MGGRRTRTIAVAVACLLLPLLATAAGIARAIPGTLVIDFEDRAPGEVVTDQYAEAYGVTFNGPTAVDFSRSPGFTQGRIAIEQCYGVEFGCEPLRVHFTAPLSHVAIMFGVDERLETGGRIVLEASDAQGGPRGSDSAPLGPSDLPQPVGATLIVDDADGAITDITLRTEDVPLALIAFDMLGFLPYQAPPPTPQLAFAATSAGANPDVVIVSVVVANVGTGTSAPATVVATADGWSRQAADLPELGPGGQASVDIVLPIPADARGTAPSFQVTIDPEGVSGDGDPSDNQASVTIEVPVLESAPPEEETQAPPPTAEPTPTPPGEPAAETGPGIDPTLVLLGGIVVVTATASALVVRARRKVGPTDITGTLTLTDGLKAELELQASDADPPETCQRDGSWYCQRRVVFHPRRRTLAALTASGTRDGKAVSYAWPVDVRTRLLDALRHIDDAKRPRETTVAGMAAELARSVARAADGPLDGLVVKVHVTGPDATATFTPYRCRVDGAAGRYEKFLREWSKTVADAFDRTVAGQARLDESARSIERLERSLLAGFRVLAQDL